jgi:hypothetical protein
VLRAALVLTLLVIGLAVWQAWQGPVFEKNLVLEKTRDVVPKFARDKGGTPFSGRAYGTFFGDRWGDCTEWEGPFENGLPHGEFTIYKNCKVVAMKFVYERGRRL